MRDLLSRARSELNQAREEFDQAREAWRGERHELLSRIEQLEQQVRSADFARIAPAVEARTAELTAEVENLREEQALLESEFGEARSLWESQRESLRVQIAQTQTSLVDAVTRANNPVRNAMVLREQLQARLEEARLEWQKNWDLDRQRLHLEIARLQKMASVPDAREKARKAIRDHLGKGPPVEDMPPYASNPLAAKLAQELEKARLDWDHERAQLAIQVDRLQREAEQDIEDLRGRVRDELHSQYSLHVQELQRKCARLEEDLRDARLEVMSERKVALERMQLEQAAQTRLRSGMEERLRAEIEKQFAETMEEGGRARARLERMLIDSQDEWEIERRRLLRSIGVLEDALAEARRRAMDNAE